MQIRISQMPKPFAVVTIALLAGLTFSPILCAQTAAPAQPGKAKGDNDKWNSDPYNGNGRNHPAIYNAGKSAPPPRRDLSGIWDASTGGGVQAGGAAAHPAQYPGDRPGSEAELKRFHGEAPDENGIEHPVPYTPLGEAALEANKPSGQSIRAVPSVLANDPVDICEPVGFPYLENFEFLTIRLAQTKNQVIYLGQYFHNWRVIWTDGRELPKDPKPRWNGYAVGHWQDDYTFVAETVGMNEKSWIDHAGRPHSKDLRVTEIFHLVDHDTMEHTEIINDPKMYTEPWMAHNKLILHREPPDFDIREMFCSPSETAGYNNIVGEPINPQKK
jgi:hypothetical protein